MELLFKKNYQKNFYKRKEKVYSIASAISTQKNIDQEAGELNTNYYSVYFVSMYNGKETLNLAIDTAIILSTKFMKSCIVIDLTKSAINHIVEKDFDLEISKIHKLSESKSFYIKELDGFNISRFHQLASRFDYLLIVSENISDGKQSLELVSEHCNSGILFVPAGVARRPVVIRVLTKISNLKSNFLGIVITKKKKYIPDILYKLLFKRSG